MNSKFEWMSLVGEGNGIQADMDIIYRLVRRRVGWVGSHTIDLHSTGSIFFLGSSTLFSQWTNGASAH